MTSEDVRSELERDPFVPLRLHLVSGKVVEVNTVRSAWLLQHSLLVLHSRTDPSIEPGYDILALRNIERLERSDHRAEPGGSEPAR